MAKREPLGRDPLEWIKRTKPAGEEEEQPEVQPEAAQPAEAPAEPIAVPPRATPEPQAPEQPASWLDSLAETPSQEAIEPQAVKAQPVAPEAPPVEVDSAPAPAEAAVDDAPAVPEGPTTVQAAPEEEEAIEVQATEPAPIVQDTLAEGEALPSAVAQPDEEEPTEILGTRGEEEQVTADKLRAEQHYVHVGSTDDEVQTLPKPDSDEYAAVGFPAQEQSMLFPIIMIVCIILMGLLVYMWAETRIRGVEQRLTRIEKTLNETRRPEK